MICAVPSARAQQDDCTGLKGSDGAITECEPASPTQEKSDRPSPAVTGSLAAEKTDRGGARLLASELIGQTLHTSDGAEAG